MGGGCAAEGGLIFGMEKNLSRNLSSSFARGMETVSGSCSFRSLGMDTTRLSAVIVGSPA